VTPFVFVAGQPVQVLLWHRCSGHLSVEKFRSVIPVESSISYLGYVSCKLDKYHRATFQSRVNNRNSSAFELVYSDVWDPNRVPSIKSFTYFLLFIDDFSRMTWLYLLKERS